MSSISMKKRKAAAAKVTKERTKRTASKDKEPVVVAAIVDAVPVPTPTKKTGAVVRMIQPASDAQKFIDGFSSKSLQTLTRRATLTHVNNNFEGPHCLFMFTKEPDRAELAIKHFISKCCGVFNLTDDQAEKMCDRQVEGKKTIGDLIVKNLGDAQRKTPTLLATILSQGALLAQDGEHEVSMGDKYKDEDFKSLLPKLFASPILTIRDLFFDKDNGLMTEEDAVTIFKSQVKAHADFTPLIETLMGKNGSTTLFELDTDVLLPLLTTIMVCCVNPPDVTEILAQFAEGNLSFGM
jgi:hypothetical protein